MLYNETAEGYAFGGSSLAVVLILVVILIAVLVLILVLVIVLIVILVLILVVHNDISCLFIWDNPW